MTKLPPQILLLCALISACATAPTTQSRPQELKVSRAVLYQNGIGYFERRGKLEGDVLRIRVRPDQIRDVLKSLTVVDLSEGRAVSIALPIEKSRFKQLSELPEQVRNQGGLLATAQAFRGARCKLEAGGGSAKGRLWAPRTSAPRRRRTGASRCSPTTRRCASSRSPRSPS
jgi:hypothetical protein